MCSIWFPSLTTLGEDLSSEETSFDKGLGGPRVLIMIQSAIPPCKVCTEGGRDGLIPRDKPRTRPEEREGLKV